MCNIRGFYCLRELCEADFHKPEICGSERAWANAWDVMRCMPSGGDRGRRLAVNRGVLSAAGFLVLFFVFFLRTHMACCKREAAWPYLPLYLQ